MLIRPLSLPIPPPSPAEKVWRCCQLNFGWRASQNLRAPPLPPFFSPARHGTSELNAIYHSKVIAFLVVKPVTVWATSLKWHCCWPEMV